MSRKKHPHHGPTLDEFLEEEGLTEEVNAIVQKRALAGQLREAMVALKVSESELARRMYTSRTVVRNLLDPDNDSATLVTLAKAAYAVGRRLVVDLEPSSHRVVVVGSKAAVARAYKVKDVGSAPTKKASRKKSGRRSLSAG